jgi:predicted transcriptional regulator
MREKARVGRAGRAPEPSSSDPVATIRDKGFLTRILILSHLRASPRATLREVGERIGITMQAVSLYVQTLEQDGHVEAHPSGGRRVTPKGHQWLQDGLLAAKRVIEEALDPLTVIKATSAIAGGRIEAGGRVGLTMENGILMARADRASPSQGHALNAAKSGEEVLVTDLEGVVPLNPGRIFVIRLPRPEDGGSTRVDTSDLAREFGARIYRGTKTGVIGLGARIVAERLGRPIDFEFGAAPAAFHAAELGLDSILLVAGDEFRACMSMLEKLNAQSPQHVVVDVLQAPATRPGRLHGDAPRGERSGSSKLDPRRA